MSAEGLKVDLRDGIMILTLANPPLNSLTPDLQSALLARISDPPAGCRGIVLAGEGAHFSGHLPTEDDTSVLPALCGAVATAACRWSRCCRVW